MALELHDLFTPSKHMVSAACAVFHKPRPQARGRWAGAVACAKRYGNALRAGSKLVYQRIHQGCARGRNKLLARICGKNRFAAHKVRRCGRWQRDAPVGALNASGKPRQGRGAYPAHAQGLHGIGRTQNIHEGIDGPHLVKVHLSRGNLVRVRFGFSQCI